jgi:hypothetical protein
VASSVRGAITNFSLEQKCEHEVNKVYREKLSAQLHYFTELSASGCRPPRRQPNFGKQMMYIASQTLNLTLSHSLPAAAFCVTCHPSSPSSHPLLSHGFSRCRNVELVPLCASSWSHSSGFSIVLTLSIGSHAA